MGEINTVASDLEGTLYPGKGTHIDALVSLAFSRIGEKLEAEGFSHSQLSLHAVTGRPEAYGEGFLQNIRPLIYTPNSGPHIFEKGSVITQFGPRELGIRDSRIVYANPEELKLLQESADLIRKAYRNAIEEPGKVAVVTFNAPPGMSQDSFNGECRLILERAAASNRIIGDKITWTTTPTSFDILLRGNTRLDGMNKLFRALNERGETNKGWNTCAYLGDSEDDITCLESAAFGATFPDARPQTQLVITRKGNRGLVTPAGYVNGIGAAYAFARIIEHVLSYQRGNKLGQKHFAL